jgi:hypothetical protein
VRLYKTLDTGTLVVIIVTFVLFALAIGQKGFTHDLLLESGIFLVSVKLILMAYKSNIMKESIETKLDAIHEALITRDECRKPKID